VGSASGRRAVEYGYLGSAPGSLRSVHRPPLAPTAAPAGRCVNLRLIGDLRRRRASCKPKMRTPGGDHRPAGAARQWREGVSVSRCAHRELDREVTYSTAPVTPMPTPPRRHEFSVTVTNEKGSVTSEPATSPCTRPRPSRESNDQSWLSARPRPSPWLATAILLPYQCTGTIFAIAGAGAQLQHRGHRRGRRRAVSR